MVRPIAGKPFVVSRGFRLFRELFKFQNVEKLRDDRINLAAVTGEIQGTNTVAEIEPSEPELPSNATVEGVVSVMI